MGGLEQAPGHEQGGGDAGAPGCLGSLARSLQAVPGRGLPPSLPTAHSTRHFLAARPLPQKYIDLVAAGDPNWESHEALKDYKEEEQAA